MKKYLILALSVVGYAASRATHMSHESSAAMAYPGTGEAQAIDYTTYIQMKMKEDRDKMIRENQKAKKSRTNGSAVRDDREYRIYNKDEDLERTEHHHHHSEHHHHSHQSDEVEEVEKRPGKKHENNEMDAPMIEIDYNNHRKNDVEI